ncbi:helix-turn-helix domain-containing protein [Methylobacterium sp. J-090]|nr:helix-turn-helix domain-containing protein [Methylobacterium sp. J-090]MCJ2081135.1 helix-turn-helix domain-containing protein [Methylobacterium sp. J-090]
MLTTDEIPSRDRFGQWCERLRENYFPMEGSRDRDGPFEARLEAFTICNIPAGRLTQTPSQYKIREGIVRKKNFRDDFLTVSFRKYGVSHLSQNGGTSIQRPGDIVIMDVRSLELALCENNQNIHLSVPRHSIEKMLGNAKSFTALTLEAAQASTRLVNSFFAELLLVQNRLSPDAAARMGSIGIDLIVAGLADRLAREAPKPLHGTLVVQRAKAYIEANISDGTLDPPHLAAAMGVSLRRLQELFHEQGRHISAWIWERRLETAARCLADPKSRHVQIANLAYDCGFSSQSHFSRRFKDRFGMTPRDYREHAKF